MRVQMAPECAGLEQRMGDVVDQVPAAQGTIRTGARDSR